MKTGEVFQSNYLKASDLQGRAVEVDIATVKIEKLGQGNDADTKPVLYFNGKSKGMVLNKTNTKMIERLFQTDEMDNWKGGRITIAPREVEYQGETVLSLRVLSTGYKMPPSSAAAQPKADEPKDDIPF